MKKIVRFVIIILILCLAFISPFIHNGYDMYKEKLENEPIQDKVMKIKEDKNYTYLSDVPKIYRDAVIAAEDRRFYIHGGVDIVSIARALINDIKRMDFSEGGSTITQQLCKNIYFSQEKRLERKFAELFMTIEVEKELEKDEILELYINTCYYGSGYYNIKEASLGYFGKLPKYLTDSECIMLAGIPNAPSVYALDTNPDLAKKRQEQVIKKMIDYGYISVEEAEKIRNSN